MRLIDADKVIYILEQLKAHSLTGQMSIGNAIYLICEQPTAYDVDKVVDELDDKTKFACRDEYCEGDCDKCDACIIPYHNAIDIVKRGGVG